MKVVYVTWLESLDLPVIKAQVLDVCKMIAQNGASLHFLYFSLPERVEISQQILNETLPAGSSFQVVPVSFAKLHFRRLNWIFLNPTQAWLTKLFVKRILKKLPADIDIFHFRSYPSATTIPWLSKSRANSQTVFDPRSPYPDELITLGIFKNHSRQHNYWEKQEATIIKHAGATVATTSAFATSLANKTQVGTSKIKVIPNNVSLSRFDVAANSRVAARSELQIEENTVVFGYIGNIGLTSWNSPTVYINFLKQLVKSGIDFCFLFLTNELDGSRLNQLLIDNKVDKQYYRIHSASFEEVPFYMSAMDLSLNFMLKKDARLSVKTVEYFAAGLPVITNRKAEGIANLIQEHSLGIVIEDENALTQSELDSISNLIKNKKNYASNAAQYVQNHCSTQAASSAYLDLYKSLNKSGGKTLN